MKYTLFFLILIGYSCNSDSVVSRDVKENSTPENHKNKRNLTPKFEDYLVENVSAKIDSQTLDKIFNTNEAHFSQFYYNREGLEEFCKLFAGKYIAIDMSQGSATVCTYIFDSSSGKMYESPLFIYTSAYKPTSRLFIKDPVLSERQQEECKDGPFECSTEYYFWDEKEKKFMLIN